ncbi:Ribosomal protein S12 methylthiotransferase RimO [Dissostichus eleginoides]|uniref:Ribosomal protein S12 methylthiotransferase RimO n=1 Tax=Dissostichus eleginoides TaxID=100907 RepID=A0AAD9B9Z5_DISEL|nr:Ribosomal protein S12 methylthiotransferase RimO [Dissostichus eleginoides]
MEDEDEEQEKKAESSCTVWMRAEMQRSSRSRGAEREWGAEIYVWRGFAARPIIDGTLLGAQSPEFSRHFQHISQPVRAARCTAQSSAPDRVLISQDK